MPCASASRMVREKRSSWVTSSSGRPASSTSRAATMRARSGVAPRQPASASGNNSRLSALLERSMEEAVGAILAGQALPSGTTGAPIVRRQIEGDGVGSAREEGIDLAFVLVFQYRTGRID